MVHMEVYSPDQPIPFAGWFDLNNPLSLYSKLGKVWAEKFGKALAKLPEAEPMLHDETVLKSWLLREHSWKPTVAENRYRYQFWLEYENAVREDRQMKMTNVYYFAGSERTFQNVILKDARSLSWIMCRPAGYESTAREMLQAGMEKLRSYLELDPFENPEKPNMKLLEMQYKITAMMDMRLHGAPTQKLQQLTVNATLGANGEIKEVVDKGDMASLQKRIEKLRERKRLLEGRKVAPEQAEPASSSEPEVIEAEVVGAEVE